VRNCCRLASSVLPPTAGIKRHGTIGQIKNTYLYHILKASDIKQSSTIITMRYTFTSVLIAAIVALTVAVPSESVSLNAKRGLMCGMCKKLVGSLEKVIDKGEVWGHIRTLRFRESGILLHRFCFVQPVIKETAELVCNNLDSFVRHLCDKVVDGALDAIVREMKTHPKNVGGVCNVVDLC